MRRLAPALAATACLAAAFPAATGGAAGGATDGATGGERPAANDGPAGPSVRVLDTRNSKPVPCRPVDVAGGPFVSGGCPAHGNSSGARLAIRTAFGTLRFANCFSDVELTVAADGRIWLEGLRLGGTSPCNDIWPCSSPRVIAMRKKASDSPPLEHVPPWRGRLLTVDGSTSKGTLGLCLDTCVGRYDGDVDVQLVRGEDGWKMRFDSTGVGAGSLEVDGEWDLTAPADFAVRPRTP